MDSLAAYSSNDDESDSTPDHDQSESSISPAYQFPLPELPELVLYLENYAMNRKKLLSGFLLLPWLPDAHMVSSLQKTCEHVVKSINSEMPHVHPRYSWHYTGANKPVVFGRYGYTNVGAVNSLHVSLFPNFFAEPVRFSQFHETLLRSIKSCSPPPEMIVQKQATAIDRMLKTQQKAVVSLRTNSHLRCYMSTKSGTIFVALDINDTPEPDHRFLAEYQYLRSLSKMIEEQVQMFDAKYDWKSIVHNTQRLDDGLPFFRYHVTILLGEVHMYKQRMNSKQFRQLRDIVQNIDVTEHVGEITVDVDTMKLRNIAGRSFDIDLVHS